MGEGRKATPDVAEAALKWLSSNDSRAAIVGSRAMAASAKIVGKLTLCNGLTNYGVGHKLTPASYQNGLL